MTKREKVIKGLEHCLQYDHCGDECPTCLYYEDCATDGEPLMRDALELLKAQEPRVMTLEEVKAEKVCWIEDKDAEMLYPAIYKCRGNKMFVVFAIEQVYDFEHGNEDISRQFDEGERWIEEDDLNKWWRPWTSRPTEEQCRNTAWRFNDACMD